MVTAADRKWMRLALRLARTRVGFTRPNPAVGAVVVRNGRCIGKGCHSKAGAFHAEVEALNRCAGRAAGATLYVTLEPCSTAGRQPPCTERVIAEKVGRVVIGCVDPNPRHAGRGLDILRAAGIQVDCGVCEAEARALIEPFAKAITTGLPFVTLKLAMTLDGRIADRAGSSQWITGEPARAAVQAMRRAADVVMVGAGTVLADDPSLLFRGADPNPLMRVVVDGAGRTPGSRRVYVDEAAARTIIATTPAGAARRGKVWARHGARVWAFAPDASGRVPLRRLLRRLAAEGYQAVLCEGGGELAGALDTAGLVDEYDLFYAPAILGDVRARPGFAGGARLMPALERLRLISVRRVGEDVLLRLRRAINKGED